jgi:restriction system protein
MERHPRFAPEESARVLWGAAATNPWYYGGVKMAPNSLFAILLRSPWWVSFLVGGGLIAGLRLVLPDLYAVFAALPFLGIGAYAAWQQLRAPSAASVAKSLEKLREMSGEEFAGALEEAFRREGYSVTRLNAREADLELVKAGRTSLVACKRWKVARTGIEPLRELLAARRKREAHECIYVATGEISDNALAFSVDHNVRLLHGAELATLMKR